MPAQKRHDKIKREIERLKEKKNAVILSHNYQTLDVQDVADFKGDSLELSIAASKTEADIIVFCGVDFMAETAAICNPDKKVLIPCRYARCPMATQLTPEMVVEAKSRGYPFIAYVNTFAAVKAEADICCTSANAKEVAKIVAKDGVCFMGPDANLAHFASGNGVDVVPVPEHGYCYVHKAFQVEDVVKARKDYPKAEIIVHPECNPDVQYEADFVGSTSQMLRYVVKSESDVFVVGTEIGLIERMRNEIKEKKFIPLRKSTCIEMKLNNLEKVYLALKEEKYEVKIDEEIADRARKSINRMFRVLDKKR
jgi:quinolinate synthase